MTSKATDEMIFQLSSGGNDAILERRKSCIKVTSPLIGHSESNCETILLTHCLFHSRFSFLTMENIEFLIAGTWPKPLIFSESAFAGVGEQSGEFIGSDVAGHSSFVFKCQATIKVM